MRHAQSKNFISAFRQAGGRAASHGSREKCQNKPKTPKTHTHTESRHTYTRTHTQKTICVRGGVRRVARLLFSPPIRSPAKLNIALLLSLSLALWSFVRVATCPLGYYPLPSPTLPYPLPTKCDHVWANWKLAKSNNNFNAPAAVSQRERGVYCSEKLENLWVAAGKLR